jgi:hypothetical protein
MVVRYLGKTNSLGFKHGINYDIKIEKPKNYYTYLITAFTEEKEIQINYASINSIKANWEITDFDIDLLLKE